MVDGRVAPRRARWISGIVVAPVVVTIAPWPGADVLAQPSGLSDGRPTTADARLLQAIDLYTGVAGRVDDVEARGLLLDAAGDDANVLARMWIARVHSRGRMTFDRDESRARALASELIGAVRDLAAAGDLEALFLMGTAYDEGLGVAVDHPEAMRWYRRAAAAGHVLAAHNLGNMYRDGRGEAADPQAAVRWWLRAARAGDVVPALRLGEAYEAGRGVGRDLDAARCWYARAARAGNQDAAAALRRLGGAGPTR